MGGIDFPATFEGPSTQNDTVALNSVGTGFIPTYSLHQMWMTESIGTGIIMSIVTAQLAQHFLSRAVGKGSSWAATCAINSFVYTIVVVMMGSSSAIFNPAVLFGWAILGRTSWKHWGVLMCSQIIGAFLGILSAWSQFLPSLSRVPIPRKDAKGDFIYVQVAFRWHYWVYRSRADTDWLAIALERPAWARSPRAILGKNQWGGLEYSPDDVLIHSDEVAVPALADPGHVEADKEAAASAPAKLQASITELDILDPEYQLELARDRKNKLSVFAETPQFYSWAFYACWWPHIIAGTTLCHWLSFMTGNASQLTNTNMYLTQPVNGTPGSQYAFLNGVLLAWLVGLAYFLLTASAGIVCTLQLNPAADLAGRVLHWVLPIPNKGFSGWTYAPVPLILPFMGASVGCAIMYMSMWGRLFFPFRPYGSMPHWW